MHGLKIHCALAALIAAASGAAQAQTDVQPLANDWMQAYNRHDRQALGALYTDDARLMMHGSPTIAGRAAIEEFWADDFEIEDPLTLLTVTHSVAGSDMHLVHGDYRVVDRADGRQLGFGRFAHVWTRAGNGWRLDRDLWNQPFEPYDATADGNEIQSLADRWTQAYNSMDADALGAVYADDAQLMMHGAPTINGRPAIRDFWAGDFMEGNPLTILKVTHAVAGTDMRLVHGDYEVVNRDEGTTLGSGRFSHIWFQGADGEWALDTDMWLQR
jgi:uncharacterized protein (TIGR02246 family)